MTQIFTFGLDQPRLNGVRFLVERDNLPSAGDMESAFLDGIHDLDRHPDGSQIGAILCALAAQQCTAIAVIRNGALVLDAELSNRIASALTDAPKDGCWSIIGSGGLGLYDRRFLALYASQTPGLPSAAGPCPLVDVMPDLYVVNAAFLRTTILDDTDMDGATLETIIATEGYLSGKVAIFSPQLSAGIDGTLKARDIALVTEELTERYSDRLAGQTVRTLTGNIDLPRSAERAPRPRTSLARETEAAIVRQAPGFTLSVVVRTQFSRAHLLERLLSSLSRARTPEIAMEIILSTDADPALAMAETERLTAHYRHLTLRLQHNACVRHSRVGNLTAGARAAAGDYVVFIDDDDYVDLFALKNIRTASFAGQRPVIVTGTELHAEEWQSTPSGRWVLASSQPHARHPARGWRDMFSGVNRLPICAMIFPRELLIARLDCHEIAHDLSEDYALFLLAMTDPRLPAIVEIPDTFCHVSIRGCENSVTMPDRRPWARDIAAHLSDLTQNSDAAGPGLWQLLASVKGDDTTNTTTISDLRRTIRRLETDLSLARREAERLRSNSQTAREAAA